MTFGWKQPDQLDIKGAFLYGSLNKEIYMKLPSGCEESGLCACLNQSIYGLKQSPRQWHRKLTRFLTLLGFKSAKFNPCVFIYVDKQLVVAICMDDLTLCRPDGPDRENFKTSLKKEFELSDLRPLN